MSGSIRIEYGGEFLQIENPGSVTVRGMKPAERLEDPAEAVRLSLSSPIGSAPLASVAGEKLRKNPDARAVVVVSDNTRPVPYRGEGGECTHVPGTALDRKCKKDLKKTK